MSAEILQKLTVLENRIGKLEGAQRMAEKLAVGESTNKVDREARFSALLAIVRQLAAREGVSQEQFDKHFLAQFDFLRDQLFRIVEDTDPNWAGQIDERQGADEIAPEPPTPLFPE